MPKLIEIRGGEKFGRLTLTGKDKFERMGKRRDRIRYVECVCECGNVTWVRFGLLRLGNVKSCGCLLSETAAKIGKERWATHGMSGSRIYHIYQAAESRCKRPNHISYQYYGGKGIKFLWNSFEEFYNDMGESYKEHVSEYGEKDTTLDRINRSGDYCKENCKRSSRKEQMYNRDIVDTYGFNYTNIKGDDIKETSEEICDSIPEKPIEKQSRSEL